jgi:hypothetical protein
MMTPLQELEKEHPVLDLLGATLTEIGVSDHGDELMLSFSKEGRVIRAWVGHDEEGFSTIALDTDNE